MRVCLDTNAVSELMRGHELLTHSIRQATSLVISVVVVGELMEGYSAGSRYEKNVSILRRFLNQPFVEMRDTTFATAEGYARIKKILRSQGTPIPTNDVWIAAHATESASELWSFDRHFEVIPGLHWRPWFN